MQDTLKRANRKHATINGIYFRKLAARTKLIMEDIMHMCKFLMLVTLVRVKIQQIRRLLGQFLNGNNMAP